MAPPYRPLYWIVLFVFGLLVQTALLPQVFPIGYVPSVMVSLVVLLALYESPRRGLGLGIMAGALTDLLGGRLIGLNTATYGLLGYYIAKYQERFKHDQIFVPGLIGALSQLIMALAQWGILNAVGYRLPWQAVTAPLPYWVLFGLLFTPAMGGILGIRPASPAKPRRH